MTVILTFDAVDGGTRYTARVRHWTKEDRDAHEVDGFPFRLGHSDRPARAGRGVACAKGRDLPQSLRSSAAIGGVRPA